MALYSTASGNGPDSLKNTDTKALADYQKTIQTQAQAELGAYDASAAAAGSPLSSSDTNKDRARAQIAENTSQQVGSLKYSQDSTYLQRLQGLLPGTGSATSGFAGAGAIDTANSNQQSGILNAIMQLAGSIPGSKSPQNPFAGGGGGGGYLGTGTGDFGGGGTA